MTYIRTVISFDEEQYYSLKQEAAKNRQSLSSVVRAKVKADSRNGGRSKEEVEKFMKQIRRHAKASSKYLKGIDGVTIIREMRDNAKW